VGYVNKVKERKKESGLKCTKDGKKASDYVKTAIMMVSVLLDVEGRFNIRKSVSKIEGLTIE
jgi:hypothetical protein